MKQAAIDVQRVRRALELMFQKVDRPDPISLIEEDIGVGRRQLERHFRAFGTSPYKELRRMRVQLAAAELASQEGRSARLLGVARRVGLRDERRLRDGIGSAYGLSPNELRRGARLERSFQQDEAMRRRARGSKAPGGLWSDYRRRRKRAILQALLKKATPDGARAILGEVELPRPSIARRIAADLADDRVRDLYDNGVERRREAA